MLCTLCIWSHARVWCTLALDKCIWWLDIFGCSAQRFISGVNATYSISLNLWGKHAHWLFVLDGQTRCNFIFTRAWHNNFCGYLFWAWGMIILFCWLLPCNNTNRSFPCYILWISNFIISGTNLIMLDTSKSNLIWFLFNKLSTLIFFISENTQVTWDRWWIHNSQSISLLCHWSLHA